MTAKIIIAANTAWYLANFRLNLAKSLQDAGFEVIALAPPGPDVTRIEAAGVRFVPLPIDNKGTNPMRDLALLLRLARLLRSERPAVFLGYTVKPNVYGGMACRLLGIPSIHNIAGLGTVFISHSWLTRLVKTLYRQGLKKSDTVFFQNRDDLDLFVGLRVVRAGQAQLLPGSGIDLERFAPVPLPECDDGAPFRFLLVARLLWDKGVGEYVEAARRLIAEGRVVECQLLGFLGADNPTAISAETVAAWEREGVVRHLGSVEDVRPQIARADCVVLPSYREGTPRSLLEAASMGRPVITTDTVGCRDTVDDGETGYLCKPRDAADLAATMRRMMDMAPAERVTMGQRGRAKMEAKFDERIVIDRYLQAVRNLMH